MTQQNNYFLVLLSAILVGLSQHPLSIGFLSWFGLVPFILVLNKENSIKKIFFYSLVWGFVYHLIVVFWLAFNIGTTQLLAFCSMIAAVLVLTVNTILISLIWYQAKKNISKYELYLLPFIWVTIEYIRSYGLLGFPWVSLANSQTDYLLLIQNAEITGIYGISFWIVLVNILIYKLIFNKYSKSRVYKFTFILLIPWITGYLLLNKNKIDSLDNKGLSFLLVQPNINLYEKRNTLTKNETLDNIINQTRRNLDKDIELIIWPESAVPFHRIQFKRDRLNISNRLFDNVNQYLLTGNIFYKDKNVYNSSILLNKEKIQGIYHKRQLVPIAEYVPLSENFNFLKKINLGQTNFSKGNKDVIFNINGYRFASLICFESTFPDINRRHASKDIDAIIYLINDGWYTAAPEPQQHAKQSIYRAIENRLPVIRCANTGISMFINSRGEIIDKILLNKFGTIKGEINKNNSSPTFYNRFGNVFAIISLIISIYFLLLSKFKNEKK